MRAWVILYLCTHFVISTAKPRGAGGYSLFPLGNAVENGGTLGFSHSAKQSGPIVSQHHGGKTMCSNRIAALALAGVMVLGLVACSPTDPEPTDTSTPEVTEPADTSIPEQTAPAEPDDQEPQETAETTADTGPTETPAPEVPTAEIPVPAPVQQPTQEQQQETQTPVIPSDGGGNPDSGAGNDAGQSTGNQGGSGNTGGNSSTVDGGQTTTPPTSGGSEEAVGGGSNPGGLTEQEQANSEAFEDTVEDMGGYYDPSTGATWVP